MRSITITFDDSNLSDSQVYYIVDNVEMHMIDLLPWVEGPEGQEPADVSITYND